jgi:hypothetical protein
VVEGESVSAIAHTTATLSGAVNPSFEAVLGCEFQYVSEAVYKASQFGAPQGAGCSPSAEELGSGDGGVGVSAGIEGLASNTTYYWRLVAANATGKSEGAAQHFTTLPEPPTVSTGAVSNVGPESVSLSGEVDPGSNGPNSDTTYFFQWGMSEDGSEASYPSYTNRIPLAAADAGQGNAPVRESVTLAGLQADTTYQYRIVASNDNANSEGGPAQVVDGEGREFTTAPTPPILGEATVSALTQSTVRISGSLNAQGLPARYELRLGAEQGALAFGASGQASSIVAQPITLEVGSLSPGSVYFYELLATSPDGTVNTAEGTFTTPSAPPVQTLALASFPQTPPLGSLVPAGIFANEAAGTIASTSKAAARCAKGRKRSHGRCVQAKAKRRGRRKGKRG